MRSAAAAFGLLACVPASGFVPVPSARFVGTGTAAGLTRAAQHRPPTTTPAPLRMAAAGDGDSKKQSPWEALTTDMAKKFAVAATVAAVAFSAPGDALAARSGGRMGGRSFSSPSVSYICACRVCGEGNRLLCRKEEATIFFHVVAVDLVGDESRRGLCGVVCVSYKCTYFR